MKIAEFDPLVHMSAEEREKKDRKQRAGNAHDAAASCGNEGVTLEALARLAESADPYVPLPVREGSGLTQRKHFEIIPFEDITVGKVASYLVRELIPARGSSSSGGRRNAGSRFGRSTCSCTSRLAGIIATGASSKEPSVIRHARAKRLVA